MVMMIRGNWNVEQHGDIANNDTDVSNTTTFPSTPTGRRTVNACHNQFIVFLQRQYVFHNNNNNNNNNSNTSGDEDDESKYILWLRDPADWFWSAWNFWVWYDHEDAVDAEHKNWASAPYQCKWSASKRLRAIRDDFDSDLSSSTILYILRCVRRFVCVFFHLLLICYHLF
jgi:hypothetical protein